MQPGVSASQQTEKSPVNDTETTPMIRQFANRGRVNHQIQIVKQKSAQNNEKSMSKKQPLPLGNITVENEPHSADPRLNVKSQRSKTRPIAKPQSKDAAKPELLKEIKEVSKKQPKKPKQKKKQTKQESEMIEIQ